MPYWIPQLHLSLPLRWRTRAQTGRFEYVPSERRSVGVEAPAGGWCSTRRVRSAVERGRSLTPGPVVDTAAPPVDGHRSLKHHEVARGLAPDGDRGTAVVGLGSPVFGRVVQAIGGARLGGRAETWEGEIGVAAGPERAGRISMHSARPASTGTRFADRSGCGDSDIGVRALQLVPPAAFRRYSLASRGGGRPRCGGSRTSIVVMTAHRSVRLHRAPELGVAARTAASTFSTVGLNSSHFLATTRSSTRTVSSPRLPSISSTSTPGSFRSASARPAACLLVPPQTGHCRIVTFFIAHPPYRVSSDHPFSADSRHDFAVISTL